MIELEDYDIDVLELLAVKPLHEPPALVRSVIEELQTRNLTVFADGRWHLTTLGREILAQNKDRIENE